MVLFHPLLIFSGPCTLLDHAAGGAPPPSSLFFSCTLLVRMHRKGQRNLVDLYISSYGQVFEFLERLKNLVRTKEYILRVTVSETRSGRSKTHTCMYILIPRSLGHLSMKDVHWQCAEAQRVNVQVLLAISTLTIIV